ncbi:MAG: hypothetical protein WC881_03645 [Elusimicrobiota bacterium]|jgi:hypothetical protein
MLRLCFLAALWLNLAAASAEASSMRLPRSASRAEDRIRSWLQTDAAIRERLARAETAADQAAPRPSAVFADPDLKDAVADAPARPDPERERRRLLAHLPGMKAPAALGCSDFKSCSAPPLAWDVAPGEPLEPAIRALLRPWLWLQEGRGRRLSLSEAAPEAQTAAMQRVLKMELKDLALSDVGLNMRVRDDGGVHIWFDRGLELAEVYSRLRERLISK